MKERSKTFLLIILVGMSIFMTGELWGGTTVGIPDKNLDNMEELNYSLSNIISIEKYLINFNTDHHSLVYDDSKYGIWTDAKDILTKLFEYKDIDTEEISKEKYADLQKQESVIFYFPEEISTYILTKAWNIKKPNNIMNSMTNINSIYVHLDKNKPFFVLSNKEKHLVIHTKDISVKSLRNNIREIYKKGNYKDYYSIKDNLKTENHIFIPEKIDNKLTQIYVSDEIPNLNDLQKSNLAERFLNKNIDYIREIVEDNGTSIYIDQQKILKLNNNGILEYFQPLEGEIKERNLSQSLITSSQFISDKLEIGKDIYLSKIKEIESEESLGYKLEFRRRIRGVPVILGNEEVKEYIEIDVFNNQIRNYKQYLRDDGYRVSGEAVKSDKLIPIYDIINKNHSILEKKYLLDKEGKSIEENDLPNKTIPNISNIDLLYFDPSLKSKDENLIPVWVIELNGKVLAFNVFNGDLVYEN